MKKKVTISDIAEMTNCSISTVSKALTDSSDINSRTKEEILKCAMNMGYHIGRKKTNIKGTIAVIIQGSDMSEISFEYQMLFGFKLSAIRHNYDIEIINKQVDDNNWSYQQAVLDKNYCGVFILRLGDIDRIIKGIEISEIPLVVFDNIINAKQAAYIGCDNEKGMKLAVDHLASLGHKKIAFYGGSPTALVSRIRKKSFISSLYEQNLYAYPELIAESNFSQNFASVIIPDFVEFGATAIVCASDLLAKYCVDELKRLGKNVPEDISVIGFDNVPIAEEMVPQLTTIDQNIKEIGIAAFELLEKLIDDVHISKILFEPKLVIRDSTCAPREILKKEKI